MNAAQLTPGQPIRLTHLVQRLVAPNPGFMTGPGTNTYLIGHDAIAVLDPGPAIDAHIDAIIAAAEAPIRWILTTHTHIDHSPASAALAARTDAEVIGMPAPAGQSQDRGYRPTRRIVHDDRIALAEASLRAIHTPGHASNHVCFLLEEEQLLFTGDHIMNGSTVVIAPPDGDMIAYLDSLRLLKDYPIETLAPGHGELLLEPFRVVDDIIAHRLRREQKVTEKLAACAPATLAELVVHVYDDVPAAVHKVALRSLHAHLLKLETEGRARCDDERWSLT